jgi:hypothetical protein
VLGDFPGTFAFYYLAFSHFHTFTHPSGITIPPFVFLELFCYSDCLYMP